MNDFLELAKIRYSVRKFKNTPIEDEKLDLILQAGQCAPTAGNFQPQKIYIIKSEEAKDVIKEFTPCLFGAPIALLVCYDKNISWKCPLDNYDSGQDEAAIVTTQMMLEAESLGIGTLWARGFDGNLMHKKLGLPENEVISVMLTLGYPDDDSKPDMMHMTRKSLNQTVKIL